jgi:hypothetical protein
MRLPMISENHACVKEMGSKNTKEKVLERVI